MLARYKKARRALTLQKMDGLIQEVAALRAEVQAHDERLALILSGLGALGFDAAVEAVRKLSPKGPCVCPLGTPHVLSCRYYDAARSGSSRGP